MISTQLKPKTKTRPSVPHFPLALETEGREFHIDEDMSYVDVGAEHRLRRVVFSRPSRARNTAVVVLTGHRWNDAGPGFFVVLVALAFC